MKKYLFLFWILFLSYNMFGQTGIGMITQEESHFYLKKGELKETSRFQVLAHSDGNNDGIVQYLGSFDDVTDLNKHWCSLSSNKLVELNKFPPQGSISIDTVITNVTNLRVGHSYNYSFAASSETSGGGSIGVGVTIKSGLKTVTIIPYVIPVHDLNVESGSFSKILINWSKPEPLFWNLNNYAIFRRDDDSVRINELNICEKVKDMIPFSQNSTSINDGKRGINSFYAVVGYDSLGEAIAISESFQPSYPKDSFSLISPTDGEVLSTFNPTFDWEDLPGSSSYDLWISEDSTFANKIEITDITLSQFSYQNDLDDHKTYFWKVFSQDGSPSNETGWYFNINVNNNSPSGFSLFYPINEVVVNSLTPSFKWEKSIDSGDNVEYILQISIDNLFNNILLEKTTHTILQSY